MNTELFTGKAQSYAKARPGYPDAVLEYIKSPVSPDAVYMGRKGYYTVDMEVRYAAYP